jgi:hypothetical protein
MKRNSTSNSSRTSIQTLIACFVLASSAIAVAQSSSEDAVEGHEGASATHKCVCSDRTLSGKYGTQIEGDLSAGLPLRTLTLMNYNGAGKFSSVDHVVVDGNPPDDEWRQSTGTYKVNPDCTGSASVEVAPGNPPLTFHFIVTDHGREILLVVDGGAIRGVGHKVD